MSFKDMMNDEIFVIKKNGDKYGPIKARVTRDRIVTFDVSHQIEAGDTILRLLPNGGKETYIVIDPCFYAKQGDIEASYQMRVRKEGVGGDKTAPQNVTIYCEGGNNKFNVNSTDNSVNIDYNGAIQSYIDQLYAEIDKLDDKVADKAELREVVEAIKENALSGKPNKTIMRTLLDALPPVASILSIGASLMSMFR